MKHQMKFSDGFLDLNSLILVSKNYSLPGGLDITYLLTSRVTLVSSMYLIIEEKTPTKKNDKTLILTLI